MNSNQEIIESRLATYIDGDLDPAERAEIEAYLQQNPQHRRLLEELRRCRELVRGLPRQAVPPEFADAFNSQLERAGLLDGNLEVSEPRMRIGAWPRMLAAAAIAFLTVGLATIVYFVLPGHGPYQVVIAERQTNKVGPPALPKAPAAVPMPDSDLVPRLKQSSSEKDTLALARQREEAEAANELLPPAPQDAPAPDASSAVAAGQPRPGTIADKKAAELDAATAPHDPALESLAKGVSEDQKVKDLLTANAAGSAVEQRQTPASQNAIVMVVRSADPGQIQDELNQYFRANGIGWQAAPQPAEWAINDSLARKEAQFIGGETPARPARDEVSGAVDEKGRAEKNEAAAARPAALAPANEPPAPRPAPAGVPVPPAPRTRDSLPPSAVAYNAAPGLARAPEALVELTKRSSRDGSPAPVSTMFVARGVSRKQSREIGDRLARSGSLSQADIKPQEGAAVALADAGNRVTARRSGDGSLTPPGAPAPDLKTKNAVAMGVPAPSARSALAERGTSDKSAEEAGRKPSGIAGAAGPGSRPADSALKLDADRELKLAAGPQTPATRPDGADGIADGAVAQQGRGQSTPLAGGGKASAGFGTAAGPGGAETGKPRAAISASQALPQSAAGAGLNGAGASISRANSPVASGMSLQDRQLRAAGRADAPLSPPDSADSVDLIIILQKGAAPQSHTITLPGAAPATQP